VDSHCFKQLVLTEVCFSQSVITVNRNISQGNAVKCLKCGGTFSHLVTTNLLLSLSVISIWRS